MVLDGHIDGYLLIVVVKLLVQGHLQFQFPRAQHEVLPHHRAWLATSLAGGKLDATDVQLYRRSIEDQQDTWFSEVIFSGAEKDKVR